MMIEVLADGAALLSAFFFALGGFYYSDAVKKIGSYSVNALRILFYMIGVTLVYLLIFGFGIPHAEAVQWLYLGISAFTGLVIGDYLFFVALKHISPRLTFLIAAPLAPIFSAFIGLLLIGEKLAIKDIAGIFIVIFGILIVLSKNGSEDSGGDENGKKTFGIITAVLCALGQGLSMVFTKLGIIGGTGANTKPLDPFTTSVIRTFFGGFIIWGIVFFSGKTKNVLGSLSKKASLKNLALGSSVSVIAIWLLLFALTHAKVGVAATLGSMMPVMIIPIVFVMKKEKTGVRGIIGSIISVAGVAVLMLA
jgi:drug/metabolite transporter (DMT)-like permease